MLYLDLILDLALLVSLSILSVFIEKLCSRRSRSGGILQGILFGGVAVLGMLHPLVLAPGVLIDGRSMMVSLCAFFFGPWATAAAVVMTIICRVALGGAGMLVGVLLILSSAGIGLWAHLRLKPETTPPSIRTLYLFGLTVHLVMIALMLLLPDGTSLAVIKRIGLPILFVYPLATILVGKVLSDLLKFSQWMEALQASEEKYRRLFESMAQGVLYHGASGEIASANSAAERILGLSLQQMQERTTMISGWKTIREDGAELLNQDHPSMVALNTGLPVEDFTMGFIPPLQEELTWILVSSTPLFHYGESKPYQVYSIFSDITKRKESEAALQLRTVELEERNSEMVRFNYTVSHDLKSPVVTIQAFLGFLERDLAANETERISKDIGFIRSAANRMAQLLDELLKISQIGRRINPSVEMTFRELAQEVIALLAGPIAESGVTIHLDDAEIVLFGDRLRLVEIWQNLIENAVKYRGEQPQPSITVGSENRGEERIFFVRDNGIGIDKRYREKIFGLFEQLDSQHAGSGMGLALVKRIVELNGGRIWVESAGKGQGSCFRFTLPAAVRKGTI